MKYIRTKDRVSLLRQPITMEKCYVVKDSDDSFEVVIDEETLLKRYRVADNIEELCDELVIITEYGDKTYREVFSIDKYSVIIGKSYLKLKTPHKIYYAIWTNKGLIYAAKLNNKGELELL